MRKILLLCFFCLCWVHASLFAEDSYSFESKQAADRFLTLTKEIRCVVCQNQSLADSSAPLANDLRVKIYDMVLENKTNDQIKAYLVKRYGEFILLKPRLSKATLLLWSFPFLGVVFIILALRLFKAHLNP